MNSVIDFRENEANPPPADRPGRGNARSRAQTIKASAITALIAKATGMFATVLSVPITLGYLGTAKYGLWVTISSTVSMFQLLDIGIANTLTNLISEAHAKEDRNLATEAFATAFWLLTALAALLVIAGWACWPLMNWQSLLGIKDPALARDASHATAMALLVLVCSLPAGLAAKILAGYQQVHIFNLFSAAGAVIGLLAVLLIVHFKGSLTSLVGGYAGAAVATSAACLAWTAAYLKPWMKPRPTRFKAGLINKIFRSGSQFFLIQLAGIIVFNSDSVIISHYLGPQSVTPYSVTWRMVGYATALQGLFLPALWPAYTEAYLKGDFKWIRGAYKRARLFTLIGLAIGSATLLIFGRRIIGMWAGSPAVPEMPLLSLMCIWMAICSLTINQSCLLGATSRVSKQAASSCLAAAINLALSIFWVQKFGAFGVLLATVASYLICIVSVQAWEVRSILRGTPVVAPVHKT